MVYRLVKVHFWNTLDNIGKYLVINFIFIVPFVVFSYSLVVTTPKLRAYIRRVNLEIEFLNITEPSVFIVIPQYFDLNDGDLVMLKKSDSGTVEGMTVLLATKQQYRSLVELINTSQKTEMPIEGKTLKSLIYGYGISKNTIRAIVDIVPLSGDPHVIDTSAPAATLVITMKKSMTSSIVAVPVKPQREPKNVFIYYVVLFFILPLLFLSTLGGITKMTYELFLERGEPVVSVFTYIKKYFIKSFLIALIYAILFIFCILNIIFQPKTTLFSILFSFFNFWLLLFLLFSFIWVFPLQVQVQEKRVLHLVKMSFLLFFDNIVLSVFVAVYMVILILVSIFTAFLIPGIASITSLANITVFAMLLKYDFLKNRDNQKREKLTVVEWSRIIARNPDNIFDKLFETRSFSDIIAPWRYRDTKR